MTDMNTAKNDTTNKVNDNVSSENDTNIEDILNELITRHKHIVELHKTHAKKIKSILKLYRKERKELIKKNNKQNKTSKDSNSAKRPNAFTTPTRISDKLCDFLKKPHGTLVSRTDVTKSISKYVKSNNLAVLENKRQFVPDKNLKNILSPLEEKDVNNGYTYFNLQRYLKNEFLKSPSTSSSTSVNA